MTTTTDPVIPRAAIVATTEARYAHRDASGPHGAVKCRCGQSFRTGVEQLQHASHAILTAAIPHLQGPPATDMTPSPEAVEAATRSFKAELFEEDSLLHPMLAHSAQWEARHKMRAALEAALPHLRPLVEEQELRLATEVALKLGRQEAAEEVAQALVAYKRYPDPHAHVCVSCSPDRQQQGPGCINCRQTGMDQTPCQAEGHYAYCPQGCCDGPRDTSKGNSV